MELYDIGCKTCKHYLGYDFFETPKEAIESRKKCDCVGCETKIIIF